MVCFKVSVMPYCFRRASKLYLLAVFLWLLCFVCCCGCWGTFLWRGCTTCWVPLIFIWRLCRRFQIKTISSTLSRFQITHRMMISVRHIISVRSEKFITIIKDLCSDAFWMCKLILLDHFANIIYMCPWIAQAKIWKSHWKGPWKKGYCWRLINNMSLYEMLAYFWLKTVKKWYCFESSSYANIISPVNFTNNIFVLNWDW